MELFESKSQNQVTWKIEDWFQTEEFYFCYLKILPYRNQIHIIRRWFIFFAIDINNASINVNIFIGILENWKKPEKQ